MELFKKIVFGIFLCATFAFLYGAIYQQPLTEIQTPVAATIAF